MAMIAAVLGANTVDPVKVAALAATTSSTAQALGPDGIWAYVADVDTHIKFGTSGVGAADTGDFYVPAKQIITFGTGPSTTYVRVYNAHASTVANAYFWQMSKF